MPSVRMCTACGRHNGPSFTHCMSCGAFLEDAITDLPHVAAAKARRFLESLSPERAMLLPPEFLQSLEVQGATVQPGSEVGLSSVPPQEPGGSEPPPAEPASGRRVGTPLGGFSFLGPRQRGGPETSLPPRPVPQQNAQEDEAGLFNGLFAPGDTESDFSWEATAEPAPAATMPAPQSPPATARRTSPPTPLAARPQQSASEGRPSMEFGGDRRENRQSPPWEQAGGTLDSDDTGMGDGVLTDTAAVEADPPEAPSPTSAEPSPLAAALAQGVGPFGSRESPFRLVMLPDEGYRGRIHFLQHRLSQTLQVDLFTARQFLQRDVPTYLYSGSQRSELEGMAEHLRSGGVTVLLIDRDRWLDGVAPIGVTSASGEAPGPVEFSTSEASVHSVYRADIAWAAICEVDPEEDASAVSLDAVSTLSSLSSGTLENAPRRPYSVLDLFLYSDRSPIRIRSDVFDFACLGESKSLAAGLNLRRLLEWLSPSPGQSVRTNDAFKRVPPGDASRSLSAVPARELDFTEYGLLLDARDRLTS